MPLGRAQTLQDLNHKHALIYATVAKPPTDPEVVKDWFERLAVAVGMKVVIPPQVVNLQTPGNEGITGVMTIETSHSSIHVWESAPVPFLNFDLYSCKAFDPAVLVKFIGEFEPYFYELMIVDRNDKFKVVLQETKQTTKIVELLGEKREVYLEAKRLKNRKEPITSEHRLALAHYASLARRYSARGAAYTEKRQREHHATISCIRMRCKKRNISFDLTPEWYETALQEAKRVFPKIVAHGDEKGFWTANVDRVDPALGYIQSNCRIVPHALNVAKWSWSPEELNELKSLIHLI